LLSHLFFNKCILDGMDKPNMAVELIMTFHALHEHRSHSVVIALATFLLAIDLVIRVCSRAVLFRFASLLHFQLRLWPYIPYISTFRSDISEFHQEEIMPGS